MAVRYFKTKDGKILVSKRDGSSKILAKRYTEVDKNGKAKAKKQQRRKRRSKWITVASLLGFQINILLKMF